ncbi:MAG: type II secretion system F family protein [Bryobacteraceae bacterium]|nr:type II secretion system F family protein [Bryobacteraceae bacterium]
MNPLFIAIFLIIFALVLVAIAVGLRYLETRKRQDVQQVLSVVDTGGPPVRAKVELLEEPEAEPPAWAQWLSRFHFYSAWKIRLEGAGLRWRPESLLGMALLGAAVGALLGWRFHVLVFPTLSMMATTAAGFLLPFLIVERKRSRRLAAFEQQFPEALEFIARAVRAGHALSVSLELLSTEAPEPVRTEFRRLFHQINLGASLEDALRDLVRRIPLVDVRFFASTVMLQRETGGNLAEILVKLSNVIRDRFRLKGQVRALSAHGRITANVITAVPVLLIIGLSIVAPGYLRTLVEDPHGKIMIAGAILGQISGYMIMRWIVNIKV